MLRIKNEEEFTENHKITKSQTEDGKKYSFEYPCESYSECTPYEITFSPGFYFLDIYGASGSTIFDSGNIVFGGKEFVSIKGKNMFHRMVMI